MSVKRTHDPLGILPDGIAVDAGDGNDAENAAAWREYLHSISIAGRVERACRRHPELIAAANKLRAQALALGAESREDWMTWQWRAAYEQLLGEAARLDVQTLAPDTLTGRKVRAPMRAERVARSQRARADAEAWQARAATLWAMPQHKNKTAFDIARLIDAKRANTVRRKIHKPRKVVHAG